MTEPHRLKLKPMDESKFTPLALDPELWIRLCGIYLQNAEIKLDIGTARREGYDAIAEAYRDSLTEDLIPRARWST